MSLQNHVRFSDRSFVPDQTLAQRQLALIPGLINTVIDLIYDVIPEELRSPRSIEFYYTTNAPFNVAWYVELCGVFGFIEVAQLLFRAFRDRTLRRGVVVLDI